MATGSTIMKESSKEAIQERVKSYFIQLTRGCGMSSCINPDCATGSGSCTDPNIAAAKAVVLAQRKAQLCVVNDQVPTDISKSSSTRDVLSSRKLSQHSSRQARVAATAGADKIPLSPSSTSRPHTEEPMEVEPTTELSHPSSQEDSPTQTASTQASLLSKQSPSPQGSPVAMETASGMDAKKPVTEESRAVFPARGTPGLSEKQIMELVEKGDQIKGTYKELTSTLWNVFSNPHLLNASFLISEDKLQPIHHKTGILVDVEGVCRSYQTLFGLEADSVSNTLVNVLDLYSSAIKRNEELKMTAPLNHVVILLENPMLHSPEFTKHAFPKLLNSVMSLALDQKATLVEWYASYSPERLHELVSSLQQLVLLTVLEQADDASSKGHLQNDRAIAAATHTMMIFYVANLVIAKRKGYFRKHSTELLSILATPLPDRMHLKKLNIFQMLLSKFDVHPSEMLVSPIPLEAFVNDSVNNEVNMIADYKRQGHKTQDGTHTFCFLDHPFILTPANKVERLYVEHQLIMLNERHRTFFNTVLTGIPDLPFLLLRVDRNDIVNDTLAQLEAIADMNPADLRKQLRVEFRGEEGIDEGGLQKEFFQLLIEKLFDPMNGMFQHDEDQHLYRFNPSSLESEQQYHLIGILLGLAIYNSVILDINFPMVVYHKLLGCSTVFADLESSHPQISQSLKSILEFEETESQSFQDTFMINFTATYTDLFVSLQVVPLKEGGEHIPVTMENRAEYVELYADWLLNKGVADQFNAFKKGFDQVMGESNLADLFTAEEIELLVCGCKEWDFNALEENTRYDGFDRDHPVVRNFWEVFNEFSEKQKKQLLAFVTGSDRVPVGGLSKLRMIIVKNGPDSDRLPTAHTCFNALLLCNYSSKEKLRDRLSKAISHGKGFGML